MVAESLSEGRYGSALKNCKKYELLAGCKCFAGTAVANSGKGPAPAQVLGLPDQIYRRPDLLGIHIQLIIIQSLKLSDGTSHGAGVSYCLYNIASACFTLRSDHCGSLSNAPQSLTKVSAPTDERDLEVVLVDVMNIICWCEHLKEQQGSRQALQT